ncbi:MAG TPA: sigma-54-dependent Fis family transcriptional regulator [bacterium (Candidatus Stahlbacteria)]|nr:sigma-54-dependent Fis family transcriptional regulator [Candidatus Stahlbacteria bacterium]
MKDKKLLVVDDDLNILKFVKYNLEKDGYRVLTVQTGEECLDKIEAEHIDLVLLDMRLPGIDGIETFKHIKRLGYKFPVIMITAYGTVEKAVEAMKLGVYDFLSKPLSLEELKVSVRNALAAQALKEEVNTLRSQLKERYAFANIVGNSKKMQEVYRMIDRVIQSDVNVLIQGESGTGKELIAKAIHFNGPRKDSPFIDVSCAAIPEALLESELFGHEKGAFTDAISKRIGKIERANGGTLFLDEIGEMSLATQAKILRFLEERTFERVGGKEKITANVRIISATNRKLQDEVKAKRFREDLYYRIAVFPIYLPPLRERKEDIPLLVAHFLKKFGKKANKEIKKVTPEAMEALMSYEWPGNVRELENVIQRAIVLTEGDTIDINQLPMEVQKLPPSVIPDKYGIAVMHDTDKILPFQETEKRILLHALKISKGNISQAAKELNIGRATLYRKAQKYGLLKKNTFNSTTT